MSPRGGFFSVPIAGARLLLPANFAFIKKLPERFSVQVIARGGVRNGLPVFEVEIFGQRLALPAKAELIPGRRYEVEKAGLFELRVVRQLPEDKNEHAFSEAAPKKPECIPAAEYFPPQFPISLAELAVFPLMHGHSEIIALGQKKFYFALAEFDLRGIFYAAGEWYSLFLCGKAAENSLVADMKEQLAELKIRRIRIVPPAVFERLSQGAIDLTL